MSYGRFPFTSTPIPFRRSPMMRSAFIVPASDGDAVDAVDVRFAAQKRAGSACQIDLPGPERRGTEYRLHQRLVRHHPFVPRGGGFRIMGGKTDRVLHVEAV